MENKTNLEILFKKYADGSASKEEVEELINYFQEEQNQTTVNSMIDQVFSEHSFESTLKNLDDRKRILESKEFLLGRIRTKKPQTTIIKPNSWRFISAAASILLIASLIFIYRSDQDTTYTNTVAVTDILPGSNKAFLTLADGKKISLSDSKNGVLANQSGVSTTISARGIVTYSGAESQASNAFNIIETPRGGEFQVQLPDGTKVWLNASSSLKYPLSFSALKERRVELTGEAYFEVAHNKALPFRVVSNGQLVEVLGTHFNINSYADENKITTTLEEGSVKVTSKNQTKTIKPGEQTLLKADGNISVGEADLRTALAWRNGKIQFKDADIKTIMRQASRWYNIDVAYEGELPERSFNGGVARKSNLSSLLKILELNNIHFRIEANGSNKKLIVKP